ncbi:MAG: AraD1 family protein [Ferruginibacter sp.]
MSIESMRLVQIIHPQTGRSVALVREPSLVLLKDTGSIYQLALDSLDKQENIENLVLSRLSGELLDYNPVYEGKNEWKLLPSFDHPQNPSACIVSGTGLTHKNSALNRQMMHGTGEVKLTDSMQMYQWGLEGGRPENGAPGVQPEWFYKGTGNILRGHGERLEIPWFGNDGGEEPEVAGVYIVDRKGQPWRIGLTTANEFSDHIMEKKNYLYLAPSKLRNCAIGPELVLTSDFESVHGTVSISRDGIITWSKNIQSGEKNMAHSLANLEHHHFKYPDHRVPFQVHVHFFGADAFSFGDQVVLQDGDLMIINWEELGRPLKNPLQISIDSEKLVKVKTLTIDH